MKYKIPGWALELMKSKVMQTRITWKPFTAVWRSSVVPPVPAHLQFLSADTTKLISEEQAPCEVGWAFRWCTKQGIFYQWQGYWTTTTSPNEQVTQCHSNPGGSSDSYPSTIQQQNTQIRLNSCGKLWGGGISNDG